MLNSLSQSKLPTKLAHPFGCVAASLLQKQVYSCTPDHDIIVQSFAHLVMVSDQGSLLVTTRTG